MSDPAASPTPLTLGDGEILTTWERVEDLTDEWEINYARPRAIARSGS